MVIKTRITYEVNMRKKELLKRIEQLDNEVAALKLRVAVLEAGKTAHPEPFLVPPIRFEPYYVVDGNRTYPTMPAYTA